MFVRTVSRDPQNIPQNIPEVYPKVYPENSWERNGPIQARSSGFKLTWFFRPLKGRHS